MVFGKLRSFFAKKHFAREGKGKNVFSARNVKKRERTFLDINEETRFAAGIHGKAFDLKIFKGGHKAGLVIKKFHHGNQTEMAEKEFALFNRLKALKFPVPPTIRIVEINGKKYVALTDLSRFGQVQVDSVTDVGNILGKETEKRMQNFLDGEEERARKAGIRLHTKDCWEFVIDEGKGTCRPFILDLGHCRML